METVQLWSQSRWALPHGSAVLVLILPSGSSGQWISRSPCSPRGCDGLAVRLAGLGQASGESCPRSWGGRGRVCPCVFQLQTLSQGHLCHPAVGCCLLSAPGPGCGQGAPSEGGAGVAAGQSRRYCPPPSRPRFCSFRRTVSDLVPSQSFLSTILSYRHVCVWMLGIEMRVLMGIPSAPPGALDLIVR